MKVKKKSKEKETNNDVPYASSFFLAPFIIFLCFFSREIKMRGVYVGGNERKREGRWYFFSLPPSICFF